MPITIPRLVRDNKTSIFIALHPSPPIGYSNQLDEHCYRDDARPTANLNLLPPIRGHSMFNCPPIRDYRHCVSFCLSASKIAWSGSK